MSREKELYARSESKCELCASAESLGVYEVPPGLNKNADGCILICETCRVQIENPEKVDVNHWRCLNESMWSQVPSVQVMAWRMLKRLESEPWSQDLLDMLYLDEETQAWAAAGVEVTAGDNKAGYIDANGLELKAGDAVTIIKDLNVKGANFTAKRGTLVRGISLDPENSLQIEGRVNGQQIVIFTKFVKKAN